MVGLSITQTAQTVVENQRAKPIESPMTEEEENAINLNCTLSFFRLCRRSLFIQNQSFLSLTLYFNQTNWEQLEEIFLGNKLSESWFRVFVVGRRTVQNSITQQYVTLCPNVQYVHCYLDYNVNSLFVLDVYKRQVL